LKNLITRTITGAVYITIIIGSILSGKFIFAALFLLILIFTLNEFYRLCKNGDIKPQVVPGISISVITYILLFLTSHHFIETTVLLTIIPLFIIIPIIEIFRYKQNPVQNISFTIFGIVFIALPYSFFNSILIPFSNQPEIYKPEIIIGLMVIIWANDSGAYLFGKLLGKHKLIERISPNKTWEGAIGGAIFGILISVLFFHFFNYFNPLQVVLISSFTIIAGTFGDLAESMIKRNFNVKDSGKILPGHGGLLDRFDSMLFAAPIYFVLIYLILN
jgi:phosphatidate cytidylyltransferase